MNYSFEIRKKLQINIKRNNFLGIKDSINEFSELFRTEISDKQKIKDFHAKSLLQDIYQIENTSVKINCFSQLSDLFPSKGEALIHAMEYQQNDILEYYIKSNNLNLKNQYNVSPLIFAVMKKNIDLAKTLIDYGADVNILGDYNNNAMHYAIDQNDIDMAQFLISKNIDLNQENDIGDTSLMRAIRGQNKEIISFLCGYPETLLIDRENKENPLQLAIRELVSSSISDSSIASMVCIQFAINFPEKVNEFKSYDGYEIIRKDVDSILSNIELENNLQNDLNSKKIIKCLKI